MKNILFAAKPPVIVITPSEAGFARMYSFWDNEAVDDVTERFFRQPLSGAAVPGQVLNGKLISTGVVDPMEDSETLTLPASKPFCIQLNFQVSSMSASLGTVLFGVYDVSTSAKSWGVILNPNGLLQFIISGSPGMILSGGGITIKVNTAYHLAVERDSANRVTMYVNGIAVGSLAGAAGSPLTMGRVAVRKETIGTVWDLSIARKAVYNGPFTPPVKREYADYTPTYPADIAADIVAQFPFRRDDTCNEVTGKPMIMEGNNCGMFFGNLRTGNASNELYRSDINYFGAGDFTYEFKFRVASLPTVPVMLLGHHDAASIDTRNMITLNPNGGLQMGLKANGSFSAFASAGGLVTPGTFYHMVVERVNNTVKAYLNGLLLSTITISGPLDGLTGNRLGNIVSQPLTRYIWDIRIAKRAMYRGVIVAPDVLPRMPVDYKKSIPARTLREGSITSSQGNLRGFAKNFLYAGQGISIGDLYPQVYWNTSTQKMIRIKAIMSVGTTNAILAWAPSKQPRLPDTPTCTNTLKIGNEAFDLSLLSPPPTKVNNNDNSVYYTSSLAAQWTGDETTRVLQFT